MCSQTALPCQSVCHIVSTRPPTLFVSGPPHCFYQAPHIVCTRPPTLFVSGPHIVCIRPPTLFVPGPPHCLYQAPHIVCTRPPTLFVSGPHIVNPALCTYSELLLRVSISVSSSVMSDVSHVIGDFENGFGCTQLAVVFWYDFRKKLYS